jgi:16S rRNA (guanine966-N2)-methyltransferase
VRIIGGKLSGRRIEVSNGFNARPTTDFAREALFNILNNHFDFDSIGILDLFCGTGSLSFEFASRGCENIDLVDTNGKSLQLITKLAGEMEIKGIHPVKMDVFNFIRICRKKYDIVLADPPYELNNITGIPDLILKHGMLNTGGWFILEHGKSNSFKDHPGFFDERKYGAVHFSFFKQ